MGFAATEAKVLEHGPSVRWRRVSVDVRLVICLQLNPLSKPRFFDARLHRARLSNPINSYGRRQFTLIVFWVGYHSFVTLLCSLKLCVVNIPRILSSEQPPSTPIPQPPSHRICTNLLCRSIGAGESGCLGPCIRQYHIRIYLNSQRRSVL